MDHMQIAQTILSQLGGGRFKVMTGAKNFLACGQEDGSLGALSFQLPSRFAKGGINHVKISLMASDTYTIVFSKIGPTPGMKAILAGKSTRPKVTVIATCEDIYCDQLQAVFTRHTGLDTHL